MARQSAKARASKAVVLLSGGLDSAACVLFMLARKTRVEGLFVDYGQAAVSQEIAAAKRVARKHGIPLHTIKIGGGPKRSSGEVIARNAFLVLTAVFSGNITRGQIVIGIHAGTPYFDCSPAFLKSISNLVEENTGGRVTVSAPFLEFSKAEIFQYLNKRKFPTGITYSCEAGGEKTCGKCLSCRDREALHAM